MDIVEIIVALIVCATIYFSVRIFLQKRRRKKLLATPLSSTHRAIAAKAVPLFNRLPSPLCSRLEGLVNLFLDQVTFIGCDGLKITEEMRVVIAAQASFLIVNKENRWYDTLRTIMLYPAAFTSKQTTRDGHLESEQSIARLGESWKRGPVILSWQHSAYGAFIDKDGHNVVMHEFAHQLDEQTGVTDGSPLLDENHKANDWAAAFQEAYNRHTQATKKGSATLIDAYGATAPAEFFAVVVELFFEKPGELKEDEPKVYDELAKYFRLNPVEWI